MRFIGVLGVTSTIAGCSLLVSTSDLTGGTPDAGSTPDSAATSSSSGDGGAGTIVDGGASDAEGGSNVPELPGLIGKWLFDDGTPNDSSGNGRNGQLEGNSKIVPTDRGSSVRVQTDGHFTVGGLDEVAFPKSGTISLWFQYATMDVTDQQSIFDSWTQTRNHIFVRHANGSKVGEMQIAFQKGAADYELATGFDTPASTWAHVVVTWDAAESYGRAYVDGKDILADNYPSGSFTPNQQRMDFGYGLDGYVDDVRLYDRPLSPTEISNLP